VYFFELGAMAVGIEDSDADLRASNESASKWCHLNAFRIDELAYGDSYAENGDRRLLTIVSGAPQRFLFSLFDCELAPHRGVYRLTLAPRLVVEYVDGVERSVLAVGADTAVQNVTVFCKHGD
jgi:hypothetical protein